jgi:FkbM family methyltransferase
MLPALLALALRRNIPGAVSVARRLRSEVIALVPTASGFPMYLDLLHPAQRGMIDGAFESREQALLTDLAPPGAIVLDVGAHIGFHTLALARAAGPSGRVYAFEPWPANRATLARNLALNGIENVTVSDQALADRAGTATFTVPRGYPTSMLGSLAIRPEGDVTTLTVPTTTVDAFVAAQGLVRLDLVKIDAEGAEVQIIAGMRETLRALRPVVLMEVAPERYGPQFDAATFWNQITVDGYRADLVVADGVTPLTALSPGNVLLRPV